MAPKPYVEYAKVVGPADRHSVKSCALSSMIAADAAFDSTIPSQSNLVLKIRVLFFVLLPTACVRRPVDRLRSRCDVHTSASPPKQMQARGIRVHSHNSRKNERITIQSDNCIYMSRRFSRLHCPAKQPHIFKTCIQVQTRNVIIFIPVHCVHY